MSRESPDRTLQPTALVHEAKAQQWQGRAHFFGAAPEALRRVVLAAALLVAGTASAQDPKEALSKHERKLAAARAAGDKAAESAALLDVGLAHLSLGDHAKALSYYERALALAEKIGHAQRTVHALAYLSHLHETQRNHAKAIPLLERALPLAEAERDLKSVARITERIARLHHARGDYKNTLASYERARAAKERIGDKAGAAAMLINAGIAQLDRADLDEALAKLERGLALAEEAGQRQWEANALTAIGGVHFGRADYAAAMSFYERALAAQHASGNKRGEAMALNNIGRVLERRGDYAEALSIFARARATHEVLGDRAGAARALANIGNVHNSRGDYAQALSAWERALAELEALGDKRAAATILGNIGGAYSSLADYSKALSTLERSLKLKKALGDKGGVAGTLYNIGGVYDALGDLSKALSTLRRALASFEAMGDKNGIAWALSRIANIRIALGDYAEALAIQERALAIQEAIGDRHGAAMTLGNMGIVNSSLGDRTRALAIYERSLVAFEELGDRGSVANALGNIAAIYEESGQHKEALGRFQRALAAFEAVGDKHGVALALGHIGTVHISLEEPAQALSYFERALAGMEALGRKQGVLTQLRKVGEAHHRLGDYKKARRFVDRSARQAEALRATPEFVLAMRLLARIHLDAGQPYRALEAAKSGLKAVEKMLGGLGEELGATARAEHADLFAIGVLAATRDEDLAQALRFLESGRAGALLDALDKREALRWKAESLPPELRRLDLDAQAAVTTARRAYDLAAKAGKRKEIRAAAKALDEASDTVRAVAGRIQRELKQQAGLFYPRAETLEEIQRTLAKDQALVLYGLCVDEALALVLRRDGERVVALGKVNDVTAACEALDATDLETDPTAALAELRKRVTEPLKLGKDVKQVLVSPDGPLCYLPFGALFDQAVAMTPSGTTHALLLREDRERGTGILALGAPDYAGASQAAQAIYYRGRKLGALPKSRDEVEAIGTRKLLGADASEAGFRQALPSSKRWRAVHFACHGLVNIEKPMLSSLALSRAGEDDGFLTALEVLRTRIPADLAVLSACETATGKIVKGEGIVGLTRAFMFAGAPRVICSLWKVDDEATQALMIKYYELWNGGLGAAEALRKSQQHVRSQAKWSHPYYWAAWVLWGLPN
jgi:CHAT domain-containing protein